MTQKTKFRLWLVAAFGLGLVLAASPWEAWSSLAQHPNLRALLLHVLPRVGDAFMIAPLLAIAVEFAAAQELLKSFAFDISHHIIGRLLPAELREHMLSYLTMNWVRRRWFVEYTIEEWPNKPGFIQLASFTEYELENRSDSSRSYPFVYELEESYFPKVGEARMCHACASVDGLPLVEHKEEDLKHLVISKGTNINFRENVSVPPMPHGVYRFTVESLECLPDAFESAFIASVPVLETTVRVLYPRDKFSVHVMLSFAEESALLKTELINGDQYVIKSPILPGQCFLTRWNRKVEPTPANSSSVPQPGVSL
jgi:hypothetical protein